MYVCTYCVSIRGPSSPSTPGRYYRCYTLGTGVEPAIPSRSGQVDVAVLLGYGTRGGLGTLPTIHYVRFIMFRYAFIREFGLVGRLGSYTVGVYWMIVER